MLWLGVGLDQGYWYEPPASSTGGSTWAFWSTCLVMGHAERGKVMLPAIKHQDKGSDSIIILNYTLCITFYTFQRMFISFAVQFSSVAQSCSTVCNPMDYSMPDFPGSPMVKTLCSQRREPGFDPWSGN